MHNALKIYVFITAFLSTIMVLSNIVAGKYIALNLFGYQAVISSGDIIFPLSFILLDILAEFYGQKRAQYVAVVIFVISIITFLFLFFLISLKGYKGSPIKDFEFEKVFRLYGYICFASIITSLLVQIIDVRLYLFFKRITKGKYLWFRNNMSTIISQCIDTILINCMIYLCNIISFELLIETAAGTLLVKLMFSILSTPIMYALYFSIKFYKNK